MSRVKQDIQEKLDSSLNQKNDQSDKFLILEKTTGELHIVGEVITEDAETIRAKEQLAVGSKLYFYLVMQARENELSISLSSDAFRILGYLRSSIYLNNKVYNVANIDLSKTLKIRYAKVGKCIKELIDKKVVIFKREKRTPVYYIDPSLCFKGSFYKQQRMMTEYAKQFEDE